MDTSTYTHSIDISDEEMFYLCSLLRPLAEGRDSLLSDDEIQERAKVALAAITGWRKN